MKSISAEKNKIRTKNSFMHNLRMYKYPYLMILPAIICVFVFSYLPMRGIIIAFQDYNIFDGILGSKFVGFANFKKFFTNRHLMASVKNTVVYGAVILFGGFPFPIILALMFNELKNGVFKRTAQTIAYLPHFLSWISVIGLFYSFCAKDGIFNSIMALICGSSYKPFNPLTKSQFFLPILFISHLWKSVGWSSVIFLAAIAGIDQSLYEAAEIDGCGRWKQALHVTLPSIKSTAVIVLIMSLGGLVNVNFEQVYGF